MSRDQNFDQIADKFEKNIYGSTKGQMRHELFLYHLEQLTPISQPGLSVLDAGGGTGMMSQAMAERGHCVTLSDISADTLQIARQRFSDNATVRMLHQDILSLPDTEQYDLVICHAVLEWLTEPHAVISKLVTLIKPGGYLSLSFFNQHAQRFGNVFYGNFDYVEQGMKVKNQVRLNPNNPQKPEVILAMLHDLPLEIVREAGIRCFHDYVKDKSQQQSHYQPLLRLEQQYGSQHPYKWLGKYFMIIARKTA